MDQPKREIALDRYTFEIIRENTGYLILLFLFLILLFFYVPIQISGYQKLKEKKDLLTKEIIDLQQKQQIIISYGSQDVEKIVNALNTLVPEKEDYFSVFASLENVSRQTGFRIISYRLATQTAKTDSIALTVTGEGSYAEMINFLSRYQLSGGRLMTTDEVELNPTKNRMSLTAHFYSRPKTKEKQENSSESIRQEVIERAKITVSQIQSNSTSSSEESVSYTPKNDPFSGLVE